MLHFLLKIPSLILEFCKYFMGTCDVTRQIFRLTTRGRINVCFWIGSQFGELHGQYAVTTLDTVFVRKSHRRRGHVSALLSILANQFGDVGFSQPTSDAMLGGKHFECELTAIPDSTSNRISTAFSVITKFLTVNKQYRRTFWEVTGNGEEGNRKLIWFQLRRTNQAPCKMSQEKCTCRVPAVKSSGPAWSSDFSVC